MAFFELDEVFAYQDANEMKRLWANETPPDNPGEGEVWLDISGAAPVLKRYISASGWQSIGDPNAGDILEKLKTVDGSGSGLDADTVDGLEVGSFIRSDADDTVNGMLTSTISSGAAIKFDSGHSMITVHDGTGNFNIKCGVDESNYIIEKDGGSHIKMNESGGVQLMVSGASIGSLFDTDSYLYVHDAGVDIEASEVKVLQDGVEKFKIDSTGNIYEGTTKLEDKYIMREDFIFTNNNKVALPVYPSSAVTVLNLSGRGSAQLTFGGGNQNQTEVLYSYIGNLTVVVDGNTVCNGPQSVGTSLTYHFNTSIVVTALAGPTNVFCNANYCCH